MISIHRHYWWVIGIILPLLAVALGIFLALGLVRDNPPDPNKRVEPWTVFAVCVALGAALSNIVKAILDRAKEAADKADRAVEKEAEQRKRDEEQREVITATVGFGPVGSGGYLALVARLVNSGACKVYIRSVFLVVVEAGKKVGYQMFRDGPLVERKAGAVTFHAPSEHGDAVLEPKDSSDFKIQQAGPHTMRTVMNLNPDDVWIVARSTIGEVAVIPGNEIQDVIHRHLGSPPPPS